MKKLFFFAQHRESDLHGVINIDSIMLVMHFDFFFLLRIL